MPLTGTIARQTLYNRPLTGSTAEMTATVAVSTIGQYTEAIVGVFGALTGVLTRQVTYARALAGSTAEMTGSIAYVRRIFVSLAGALPAMAGTIARKVFHSRPLTGDMAEMTGIAATAGFLNRTLAGVLGFAGQVRTGAAAAVRRGISRLGHALKY